VEFSSITNRRRLAILFTLVLLASAACSGGGSTAPNGVALGTYALTAVNGSPPPVAVYTSSDGRYRTEVIDGAMTLSSGQTADRLIRTQDIDVQITTVPVYSKYGHGRYQQQGPTLVFEPAGDYQRPDTATVSGSTIAMRTDVRTTNGPVTVQATFTKQ
jgi:hypothetical protein